MKSCIWCACAVAVLCVSNAAMAGVDYDEGVETFGTVGLYAHIYGGAYGFEASAGAMTNTPDGMLGAAVGEGWTYSAATDAGWYEWEGSVAALAHAELMLSQNFGDALAKAESYASVSGPGWSGSLDLDATLREEYFSGDYTMEETEEPPESSYVSEMLYLSQGESVSTSAYSGVIASIANPSDQAYAYSESSGWGWMH